MSNDTAEAPKEDMRKMIQEKEQLQSEVVGLREELAQLENLSQNQRSEIQNLQLLVSETLEVSSSGSEEVQRLRHRNLELEQLLRQQQQQELSLAPATFVRSLARKLGAEADEQPNKKQSSEEGELQSIIQPLNDEIAALKTKLRDTDTQLQEALKEKSAAAGSTAPAGVPSGDKAEKLEATARARACDMCANYEQQLVGEQARADAARDRVAGLERALKLATEELEGVRSLHDETIGTWRDERAASQQQLEALGDAVEQCKAVLAAQVSAAAQRTQQALAHVTELTVQRETLQKRLDALERDNEMLKGSYMKKAIEMQNEIIDLPDNVEELQEHILRVREQLIFSQIGREEAALGEEELRTQLLDNAARFRTQDAALAAVTEKLRQARQQLEQAEAERSQLAELADKLRSSGDMIEALLADKNRLQSECGELRTRVCALQQELGNSERVQQDFVRLSQSLQVQLQRIREADTEVRWQHDEDVNECPSCHVNLPNVKKKVHCRHCGRIFCASCVSHSVPSGPRGAPARVCTVCRTLLQPHTAPYFSTEPPHSPD
ncbi:rab GTPase-binding effector protein 1 isoform X2 [Plodia interpunctella]|uniref:rab GTPase-binding effector protein 1 isoform X2 n=1 Tax=Plodia interpunctella TaxID=58824 RepID=UPI002367DA29|nr:rab GTPase-binding effector protein 1 isoform X2 [Plodia interpunctella]